MWEASWALVVKVLPRVSARNTAAAGTLMPGTGGQDRVKRVGHPPGPRPGWRRHGAGRAGR